MTILNFSLTPNEICILTDTLLFEENTHTPCGAAVKVFWVPRMKGVVVGTGDWAFIEAWAHTVTERLECASVRALDGVAPVELARLFWRHTADMEPKRVRSTIYHLGYDPKRRGFIGYRYRSLGAFRGTRLTKGIVTRPWVNHDLEGPATFPDAFIQHAVLQREELRGNGGPPLGGQLVAHRFTVAARGNALTLKQWVCHAFAEDDAVSRGLDVQPLRVENETVDVAL